MFFDSEVEIYYDLLKNIQILSQCVWVFLDTAVVTFLIENKIISQQLLSKNLQYTVHLSFRGFFLICWYWWELVKSAK